MTYLFKERLNKLMKDRNITQQMLAEKTGQRRETISSYQTGRTVPGADILYKIAEYLEVPADYLLGRDFDLTDRTKGIIAEEYTGLSNKSVEALHVYNSVFEHDYLHANIIELLNMMLEDLKTRIDASIDEYDAGAHVLGAPFEDIEKSVLTILYRVQQGSGMINKQFYHDAIIYQDLSEEEFMQMVKMIRFNQLIAAFNELAERGNNGKYYHADE